MKLATLTPFLSALMVASVVLNGMHAKDLAVPQTYADTNPANAVKVGLDLHPHMDKHFGKLITDNLQIDSRSLRLRESKRINLSTVRGWLSAMRDQLSLYIA